MNFGPSLNFLQKSKVKKIGVCTKKHVSTSLFKQEGEGKKALKKIPSYVNGSHSCIASNKPVRNIILTLQQSDQIRSIDLAAAKSRLGPYKGFGEQNNQILRLGSNESQTPTGQYWMCFR